MLSRRRLSSGEFRDGEVSTVFPSREETLFATDTGIEAAKDAISTATAFAAGLADCVASLALQLVANIDQHAAADRARSIRRTRGLGAWTV